ncbi:integrin alpha-6-like [Pholidichthys leucotaenia]
MAKHWHVLYLWSVWYFQSLNIAAFNLDTKNVLQRKGDPGSLFGFSVAFHQQHNPAKRNLLLVGAPHAKYQVNVTGVVYQCDLTTTSDLCQPIEFDNQEFLESRGISNQWMGVRVTSQGPGKSVMTCAHRYQQWSPSPSVSVPHLLTGQCYLLGDNLRVGTEERTWRRVVCDDEHLIRRRKDHEWFAYCQQGHGAAFAKDNSSLLFGAPGAYQWKGIVRMEPLDNQDFDSDEPRETGDKDQFNPKLIPLHRSSYLGFSIDSGMALIRKGELTVISGAPRGGYSGQVTFLKPDPVTRTNLSVELVLSGPGLASSFGYDVAVVDLNGDGWEDLAVGAPQFFVKDGAIGGAVYFYINNQGRNWEKVVPITVFGEKDSMFGLAIENIGDINQDGFGDVAVGAPYYDSGRVYIYCGSSGGVNRKPAQVLSPASKKVKLFGYSLAGNLDIDDNQYPDLAVGSLSDYVFVFRARPVISVTASLNVTPNEIDIVKEQCDERKCQITRTSIDLPNVTPVLNSFHQKTTVSEIILINEGCGSDNVCQSNLQLHYKFCSKKTENGQDVFKSLAREDGVAVITPSDEDVALKITVTNRNGDDAHQSHAVIMLPDTLHYSSIIQSKGESQMSCTVNDKGNIINCELGNPLQRDAEVTFYVVLITSGISLSTKDVNVTMKLETTSVQITEPVEAVAKVVFELALQIHGLARPSQVSLGEKLIGESAIKTVDQTGTSVQYEFRITNLGRPLKYFANASLDIFWPKENSVGKWLLYLTKISSKGVQSVPCSPVDEVNPLKHIKGWHNPARKRREAEIEALSTDNFSFLPTRRKYKTLNCFEGLNCVKIQCPLLGLDNTAVIILHSRLWNTTLAEDYSSFNYLDIVVDATLSLTNSPENIGLKTENLGTKVKLTVFLEKKIEFLIKVAWWIIFLTVVALLLLLVLFGFIIWKRGCIHCLDHTKKLPQDEDPKPDVST